MTDKTDNVVIPDLEELTNKVLEFIEFIDKPDQIHCNLIIRSQDKTIGLAKVYEVK